MFKKISLEISLKPFRGLSLKGIQKVCETIYTQWYSLFKDSPEVSVMFWSADGSEILEYDGHLEKPFEWAKYIGVANPEVYGNIPDLPQEELSMHHGPRLYRVEPPEITYKDLKNIVTELKAVFASKGRNLSVGTTFDPGPEFAVSKFKYKNHTEICMANTLGGTKSSLKSFVCCYAELEKDNTSYAGFPDGIKKGTPFGKFLGRQAKCFCADIGFDFIWLSNGFGFGLETWGACGAVFDGEKFDNTGCPEIKEKIFRFWKEFRKELPDLPVENRGTNLSTGMDLSSDAVPLREIYNEIPGISPPPNSPWAALNGDFGMELAGWMSHIAELPENSGYPFRFYSHDPWFVNSPWLDRYGRNPHDIYMPMAVSRIDKKGNIMLPDKLNILSIDNSFGEMPDQVPEEIIPHIKDAARTAPDEAGPVVWLYPFEEYHDMTFRGKNIDEVFFGDWFIRTAVNCGFQINTVVSTGNFPPAMEKGKLSHRILVTPTAVCRNPETFGLLKKFIREGGKVIFYGPAEQLELLNFLGLETDSPLAGEMKIKTKNGLFKIIHNSLYSAGSVNTVARSKENTEILAEISLNGKKRVYATISNAISNKGGQVAWIRGTNSFVIEKNGRYPAMLDRSEYFYPESLMRLILGEFGVEAEFEKTGPAQPDPVITSCYNRNGLYVSAYVPDMNTTEKFRFPEGAPVFIETETVIEKKKSVYHLPKASHLESRIFIDMEDGPVKCVEETVRVPEIKRHIRIEGLKNATVRFRPETGTMENVSFVRLPASPPFLKGDFIDFEKDKSFPGTVLTLTNVNGAVTIITRKNKRKGKIKK